MFWGAFPSHTPDEYQASVLKHTQENLLTAVCGSPGTGKTEVFLHLVAQQVVNRALRLVHGSDYANNLILFASTNNSAIQKFLSRLTGNFSTESPIKIPTEIYSEQFYLPGGNQSIIRRETLPKLQSSQDWLRNTEFNQDSWERAKLELIRAENEIQQLIEQNRFNNSQKAVDAEKRSQRAVVAGDPQQIEPIVNLCDDTIKQYFKTAFLDMGMGNEDYYRYAPTAKYTATAYHRAAGASGTESDLGNVPFIEDECGFFFEPNRAQIFLCWWRRVGSNFESKQLGFCEKIGCDFLGLSLPVLNFQL
jgi:hypothetical protein